MALRNQPYLPLYVQDFLTDEKLAECSAQATGVYIRIMCIMHKSEEYGKVLLRQNQRQSTRQIENFAVKLTIHLPYSYDIILSSLQELLDLSILNIDGDSLCQKRMIRDNEISEMRASAGKKGADATNGGTKNIPEAQGNFAAAKSSANSESEIEYEIEIKTEFERFWNLYDKKVGDKEKLLAKWKKLKEADKAKVFETLQKYVDSTEKQFRKNPETYLNNKSWNDEIVGKNKNIKLGVGETMNEQGQRIYGNNRIVPMDAPPRPSSQHYWDAKCKNWGVM